MLFVEHFKSALILSHTTKKKKHKLWLSDVYTTPTSRTFPPTSEPSHECSAGCWSRSRPQCVRSALSILAFGGALQGAGSIALWDRAESIRVTRIQQEHLVISVGLLDRLAQNCFRKKATWEIKMDKQACNTWGSLHCNHSWTNTHKHTHTDTTGFSFMVR